MFIKNIGQITNINGELITEVVGIYKDQNFDVYFQKDKISYVFKKRSRNAKIKSESPLNRMSQAQLFRVDMEFFEANGLPDIKFNKAITINQTIMNQTVGELIIEEGYQELVYENIYDGIDLKFYVYQNSLKYDFVVRKKGDYSKIKLKYIGAENISNNTSKLIVKTPLGNLIETLPEVYQRDIIEKKTINGEYELKGNVVSFKIENYDQNKELVIDPWATFIGGVDVEESYGTYIDSQKNTYVAGYTQSVNFPITVGALQTIKQGLNDAFLTKLDTTGNVIWSTLYGGTGDEFGYKVVVDSDDNPYLIGYTNANDLLVSSTSVFQSSSNGNLESFILKLDSAGNFIWATYFGGTGGDIAIAAGIDNNDNIYIGGFSSSNDMPTINAFQPIMAGALDAFIAKFDSTGNILWSTYSGGTNSEDVHVIAIDNQNNVIISGETFSSDFPTSAGAFQSNNNGNLDVYLVKYDAVGNRIFSTYYGGSNSEDAFAATTDDMNNIYIAGYSESLDFPIIGSNIYQPIKNATKDAFVIKFTPLGQPIKSTFVGGSGDERFTSAAISSTNSLYLAGYSNSTDIPLIGTSFQTANNGLNDGIYFKMDTALTPNYSTYIGGVSADFIHDFKVSSNQMLTFVGFTSSADFPITTNVFQQTIAGQSDAFVFQSDSIFNIITGIQTFQTAANFTVFPNPFLNNINFTITDFNGKNNYQIIIYNIERKRVLTKTIHQKGGVIKMKKEMKSGAYFLAFLKNRQLQQSVKLIKKESD